MNNIHINEHVTISDHFPLCFECEINVDATPIQNAGSSVRIIEFVDWKLFSDNVRLDYCENVKIDLENVYKEALYCTSQRCDNATHKKELDDCFNHLINVYLTCTAAFKTRRENKFTFATAWLISSR